MTTPEPETANETETQEAMFQRGRDSIASGIIRQALEDFRAAAAAGLIAGGRAQIVTFARRKVRAMARRAKLGGLKGWEFVERRTRSIFETREITEAFRREGIALGAGLRDLLFEAAHGWAHTNEPEGSTDCDEMTLAELVALPKFFESQWFEELCASEGFKSAKFRSVLPRLEQLAANGQTPRHSGGGSD